MEHIKNFNLDFTSKVKDEFWSSLIFWINNY